jgi:hypothetical protein
MAILKRAAMPRCSFQIFILGSPLQLRVEVIGSAQEGKAALVVATSSILNPDLHVKIMSCIKGVQQMKLLNSPTGS